MRNEKTTRKEKMVNLKSVNCVIDEETLITYPVNKNGKADLNNGIHLTETCEEWNEALTHKDFMACCDLMGNVMRNFS